MFIIVHHLPFGDSLKTNTSRRITWKSAAVVHPMTWLLDLALCWGHATQCHTCDLTHFRSHMPHDAEGLDTMCTMSTSSFTASPWRSSLLISWHRTWLSAMEWPEAHHLARDPAWETVMQIRRNLDRSRYTAELLTPFVECLIHPHRHHPLFHNHSHDRKKAVELWICAVIPCPLLFGHPQSLKTSSQLLQDRKHLIQTQSWTW